MRQRAATSGARATRRPVAASCAPSPPSPRARRLAALRGQWMYFYTDLRGGHGLAGVNLNTGASDRAIRLGDPDERFISDETAGLLYTAKDNRLLAFPLNGRE